MNLTPPPWPDWRGISPPEHSAKELEHRLTVLDMHQKANSDRLNLHERVLLGILGVLYIIAQDKFPLIAKLIMGGSGQ